MNVGAGGNSGHGCTKREKGDALALQITNQRLTLRTVRMQRHVNRVAVIVAEQVMSSRLAQRAHGQHPPETT